MFEAIVYRDGCTKWYWLFALLFIVYSSESRTGGAGWVYIGCYATGWGKVVCKESGTG